MFVVYVSPSDVYYNDRVSAHFLFTTRHPLGTIEYCSGRRKLWAKLAAGCGSLLLLQPAAATNKHRRRKFQALIFLLNDFNCGE